MNIEDTQNPSHMEKRKYRNELKYVCLESELIQITKRIETFCRLDPHVGKKGIYRIRSIYFDDKYNNVFMKMKMEQIPEKNIGSEFIMRIFPIFF